MLSIPKKTTTILAVLIFTFSYNLKAQVTIGSSLEPEKAAILDIKDKKNETNPNELETADLGGLLLPRVNLNDITKFDIFSTVHENDGDIATQKKRHTGLMVYNLNEAPLKNLEKGIYVWNGEKWEKSSFVRRVNFFYMPSIKVEAPNSGYEGRIELYKEYKKQFEQPVAKSTGAPASIPFYAAESDLYYYISDWDTSVFDVNNSTIDENGVFEYKIINPPTEGISFINIILVVK